MRQGCTSRANPFPQRKNNLLILQIDRFYVCGLGNMGQVEGNISWTRYTDDPGESDRQEGGSDDGSLNSWGEDNGEEWSEQLKNFDDKSD